MKLTERQMITLELVLGSIDDKKLKDINETSTYELGEDYNLTLDDINAVWSLVQNMEKEEQ